MTFERVMRVTLWFGYILGNLCTLLIQEMLTTFMCSCFQLVALKEADFKERAIKWLDFKTSYSKKLALKTMFYKECGFK